MPGTPKLGRPGAGEAEVQAGGELERRLSSIEAELTTLREVPGQLGTVLDALEKLQARLEPPVPPSYWGDLASGLEQGASGQGLKHCSSRQRGHLRPTGTERSLPRPGSSVLEEAQRMLSKSDRSPYRTCTMNSFSSDSRNNSGTRPLIGLPAPPAEPGACISPGARQRRPSTQSDDPRAMEISRQRRIPGQGREAGGCLDECGQAAGPTCNPLPQRKSAPTVGQQRRASTCSDISQHQLVRLDPVMPNSMPEEEPEPDAEEPEPDTPQQGVVEADTDATCPSLAEGSRGTRHGAFLKHRESVNSSLSLGGDIRQSIQSTNTMFLGRDEEGLGPERWVLHPSSCLRSSWDLLMVLLTIVAGTVVSVALCYHGDDLTTNFSYVAFLNVVSGVWWLDICLNFCTGFYQSGKVARSPRRIAERYFHQWLVPDLLSAVPLVTSSAAAARALSGLKLVRLLRLGPLLAGREQDHRLLGLPARVGVMVLTTTMATTCLWRLTLHADEARGAEGADPPVEWWELLVADMYWVAMTMSTVGFGDIAPVGAFSRLFAILAMLVAPIFFGTIVSLLTHVTQSIFNDEIEIQVAEANRFMRQRHLPSELQRRVEHNLRYQIRQERLTLKPSLYGKLSTAVQREISLELLRSSVLNFPLFRGVLHSFIAEIAQAHTWVQCLTGDLVVEEGQLMQEVVFVIRGRMQMNGKLEDMDDDVIEEGCEEASQAPTECELGAGAWFSEAALFYSDRVRTVTVYAAADSELAVLLSSDYHRIVQKYPRLLKRHQGITKALQLGQLSLRDLAYTGPMEPLAQEPWGVPRGSWDWLRHPLSGSSGGW